MTCKGEDCKKKACFNVEGERPKFCATHKLAEMVNVHDKRCIYPDCKIQPWYNLPEEKKGLYCSTHKLNGMVNVKSPKCIFDGCKVQPCFNFENEKKGIYC